MKALGAVLAAVFVFVDTLPRAHAQANISRVATSVRCELIGLGAVDTVPFNFPGADANVVAARRAESPLVLETSIPAGANADLGRVFAGDMGWPFEHQNSVFFIFDDALFPPDSAYSECALDDPSCARVALHDEVLAVATELDPAGCIDLQIERDSDSSEFLPITLDGNVADGGLATGLGVVIGPGFSSGKFVFALVPQPATNCVTDLDCVAASGVEGDVCVRAPSQSAQGSCYFGACEAGLPCAGRLGASTLAVRTSGSLFVSARIGEHIQSEAANRAYRGHFATITFQSLIDSNTGDGVIWGVGRDSYWGTPGLTMSPYLMLQPVTDGLLGEPQFFAGLIEGAPLFSPEQHDAVPLYEEDKILPQHSSLAFVPHGDGGLWLMIYGGHSQRVLRDTVGIFVSPAVDDLFYDRAGGIYLRWARQPWGPWSQPITIWSPYTRGQGGYCEHMYFDDPLGKTGYACPDELVAHNAKLNRWPPAGMAGEYGASIVPRLGSIVGGRLSFSWLLSTWNPYRVLMLDTQLDIPAR